jgi:5'-nucleotidase / UDP-sugar diphosphatase
MGRETKFLLALLGMLAGVLFGVVSLKLFSPRPPAGVGPDVHTDIAATEAQDLVEPPALAPPPARFEPPASDPYAGHSSRFGGGGNAGASPPSSHDPLVVPASFEIAGPLPDAAPADLLPPPRERPEPAPVAAAPVAAFPIRSTAVDPSPVDPPPRERAPLAASPSPTSPMPDGEYVAQPGDSWWSLAERAYGDGRLYRGLFAWNRVIDPRVTLAPGTRLEIPTAAQLGAAWPALQPRD